MLLTEFKSIGSSFKKIVVHDSFFNLVYDHDFRKMTPTYAMLKIIVNEKLNCFQAMQRIKSENGVAAVQH